MVGASKILTVSYGTFSCTLEGFDDPFNTMKAIAEYFRDLAAEDRYFGAEPPTPDAAMLHRIAEREIQRRVEAKIQENGVILRAGDSDIPAKTAISAPVASAPAAPAPQVAAEETPPAPRAAEPEPAPQSESVAAKLSRIRRAVAEAKVPAAAVVTAAPAAAEYFENEAAEDVPATPVAELPVDDVVEEDALALSDPDMADLALPEPAEIEDVAESVAEPVVDDSEDFTSPEPEADFGAEDALLANLAGLDTHVDEDAAAAQDSEVSDEQPEDILAALQVEAEAEILAEPEMARDSDDEADDGDDLDDLLAKLNAPATAPAANLADSLDDDDFLSEDEEEITPDAAPEPEAQAEPAEAATAPEAAELQEDETGGTASERIQRARARVIRIRRTTPQPADDAEEVMEATTRPAEEDAPLSPEAEADLLRELGEVEAELGAETPDLPPPSAPVPHEPTTIRPVRPVRPAIAPRRNALADGEPEGEAAMSRLIAETNNQMQGAENRRRLSAIAHLKAAVAATVAERRAGAAKPVNDTERQDPYREDLSRIVRPSAPNATRPSPLVLVSEQRIDRAPVAEPAPRPAEVGPIRPRRIAGSAALAEEEDDELENEDNLFADTRGFAEFAERLGAQDLGALLEAAAAYAACVEGRPQFTRPQIMRQVASLSASESSLREDSLRSFGTLLRTGRIVKVRRGQYALAEDSHYLAEARKLVG